MKAIFFSLFFLSILTVGAQEADEIKPAAKGVVYGSLPSDGEAVSANDLGSKLSNGNYEGKVTGKVKEVCKAMGCWLKIEKADGTTLMVKSKDHAFFVPQDLIGKTIVMEGSASVKEVSEEKRKHMAEDAGKTKEEIKKIKGSEKELQFVASGVKVLD